MPKEVFIGIDQSLRSTGLAWIGDGILGWKEIPSKELRGGIRLQHIKNTVVDTIKALEDVVIAGCAMEGYSYGSIGKTFELGELGGALKVALVENCWGMITVPPSTLKKYISGNGGSEKQNMVDAINKILKTAFKIKDNNVVDALGLAIIARDFYTKATNIGRDQKMILSKLEVTKPKKVTRVRPDFSI